ncbi:stress-induced protein YchH [Citrobacter sp. JGM124]|uniref:stress-induced protein YchH n=1 Tax=Citrobacter sp. JGM124 TaxID=2799789 RepID=UPI001BACACC0|nr:stress-induced protein YchH [Citrobacter sp. JGM124]MBS0847176.1 stress-induced protein YchH [Citrobacter sp. JGM124]
MKRKNATLCGNILMGCGLLVMAAGVIGAVANHLPQFNIPAIVASGAVLGIFVGAVVWLAGARLSGHEQVSDRYWWIRHFDKRCRKGGQ